MLLALGSCDTAAASNSRRIAWLTGEIVMPDKPRIGWIGIGRMGYPMAERLLRARYDVSIWNRTRAKAEPLAAAGGKIVDHASDLAGVDVVFSIVSTGKDIEQV